MHCGVLIYAAKSRITLDFDTFASKELIVSASEVIHTCVSHFKDTVCQR